MRQTKFRVFDKCSQEIHYPDICEGFQYLSMDGKLLMQYRDGNLFPIEEDMYEIMPFTGSYDKNGKEIYRGDIVLSYGKYRYEIKWWEEKLAWAICDEFGVYNMLWSNIHHIKVIGNIYETPKRIKRRKRDEQK